MMASVLSPSVRLPAAVAALIAMGVALPAWGKRVGFANVASDGAAGQTAIGAARTDLVKALGPDEVAPGPARDALEAPLATDADGDQATLERARTLIAQARDAYRSFDYDAAFDKLRQADASLRGLYPSGEVVAALVDTNVLMGQVWAARKDEAQAIASFRLARRLAPEQASLDPAKYRPQIVELYDKAGASQKGSGKVAITTDPPGAMVWIDGQQAGPAPIEIAVGAGDHYLGATLDGHVPRTERIAVVDGGRSDQTFLLERLPAEQRARAIRQRLLRRTADADWQRGAADLADVASVDVLVILRTATAADGTPGTSLEWAAFSLDTGKLGPFVPVEGGAKGLVDTLPKPKIIKVPRPDELAKQVPIGPATQPILSPKHEKWYRTWWGTSLLISGGLVLLGGVLYAASPSGPSGPFTVKPCWVDQCN
jgi:hypothetical protein